MSADAHHATTTTNGGAQPAAAAHKDESGTHSSDPPSDGNEGKSSSELERIHTFERVGTHADYYEKNGLRTEGDGLDHDGSHHKFTFKLFMALVAMSFLWVGSQIPLYIYGGIITDIYSDIGGVDRWVWLVIGYLIPVAALCPFVGNLSDIFGRKKVALAGQVLLIIGPIVTSTAHTMNVAIAGQVISGGGAGLNELISLAGTGEMVPTAKRGFYVGMVVLTIIPFAPSVVYSQLIVKYSKWQYAGALIAGWNALGFILCAIFYNPPHRPNAHGYTRKQILRRIDYLGALLSIGGVLCFMMGLQWGAYQYSWGSVHVLAPFIIGCILIVCFFIWEIWLARYPMVPHRIFAKAHRTMVCILLITFLSGANFFVMLFFWPTEIYNVYGNEPIGIGIRSLPVGFGILGGAVISLMLIPITGGRIKLIMIFFTALMTAGTGSIAVATPININTMYGLVFIASFAVGAVIIPCSIIAQIVCPDDLIATITAITLSVRYVGGAVGFTVYYNIFYKKLVPLLTDIVAFRAIVFQLGYLNQSVITEMVTLAGNAQFRQLHNLIVETNQTTPGFENIVITATQWAMSEAYHWPYYISIAFGGVCVILACFLGDIKPFLDNHIAVV